MYKWSVTKHWEAMTQSSGVWGVIVAHSISRCLYLVVLGRLCQIRYAYKK